MMAAAVLALLLAQTEADVARLQLAQQLVAEGRGTEAIPVLADLGARFPRSPEVHFYYGSALGQAGRLPEAIEQLRVATELDPNFQPAFRVLGMFHLRSGNYLPETRAALERAITLDPGDARAHFWLGQLLLETKSLPEARKNFEASLQLQPDSAQTILGYGQVLEALGEPEQALARFNAVLAKEAPAPLALLGRARCLYRMQQFEAALAAAQEAQKNGAGQADRRGFLWIVSRIYRVLERDQEAAAAERQLAELEAGFNQRMAQFRALIEQAAQFRRDGNRRMVVETLETALKLEERQDALVMLGDTYAELGRFEDAERCFVRANQVGPDAKEITFRLQRLRERLGKK